MNFDIPDPNCQIRVQELGDKGGFSLPALCEMRWLGIGASARMRQAVLQHHPKESEQNENRSGKLNLPPLAPFLIIQQSLYRTACETLKYSYTQAASRGLSSFCRKPQ